MVDSELPSISTAFGRAIKLRRVEVGFSQEELADKAELARSFVSGIERGAVKASILSVWKVATALKCKPSELWLTAERLIANEPKQV
ncbi:helix-turn-helix domain-containing protein [Alkalimonas amylolytica]|uniref:DNA-binding transcriptional regulator, XRE-family HTH domain n=1 Tax=Alkalimonas amylolytica TaxID=152573 RepID=A0A1H3YH18_ALKAM|nr:helix-turn-helix transcriptional regulator [Alkalimonas amylolytica]SEA10837.1 DNA-binding transcriptional regulator, XRE-family HTH domain [Alkalimonas amylolytica]